MLNKILFAAIGSATLVLAGVAEAATAHSAPTTSNFSQTSSSQGFEFVVGANDIIVTHLGKRGFGTQSSLEVALWQLDGTEVASRFVRTSDPSTDGWRYRPLQTPVLLEAGESYIVANKQQSSRGLFEPLTNDLLHPALNLVQGRSAGSGGPFADPSVSFPSTTHADNWFTTANFMFDIVPVPVPGAVYLFASALLLLRPRRVAGRASRAQIPS